MKREELENKLKHYFQQEGARGDLSAQQWQEVLSHVRSQKQRRWRWGPVTPLTARPVLAVAASLVLAVVVGGVSLWVAAPWEGTDVKWGPIDDPPGAGQPNPIDSPRGRPAIPPQQYFDQKWESDKSLIAPGEPVTVTITLRNVWDKPIEIKDFSEVVTLDDVHTRSAEMVAVPLVSKGEVPSAIQPGEEVTFVANVPPDVSSKLRPGRYAVHLDFVRLENHSEARLGFNSEVLFVVVPPQGALNKSVQVGEVREASGVRITLEAVHFTPEKTTIVALAVLTGPRPPKPTSAPPPPPGATATPAPTATPVGRQYSTSPWYRIDGGEWRELWGWGSYRETPEGIHLEWTLGPVPADAKTLDFSMGRFSTFIYSPPGPGEQLIGPWEWTVPLITILFPQGALEKTVTVGEAREASGIRITLELIQFTAEKTTIVALAALKGYKPTTVPTSPPVATPPPGATPTPTPAPTATPVGGDYSANSWYRIDWAEWRQLRSRGYRKTPEGIHLEGTLGPVPADAKILDFSIRRLGTSIFSSGPGEQVIGPWEWTVPLQAGK